MGRREEREIELILTAGHMVISGPDGMSLSVNQLEGGLNIIQYRSKTPPIMATVPPDTDRLMKLNEFLYGNGIS